MPARRIGCGMERRVVSGVVIGPCEGEGVEDDMVDGECVSDDALGEVSEGRKG